MPKHYSNLKHVYKKTYEELTNPNSPIGMFLAKIDRYSVEKTEAITEAVNEFISVYQAEEKNFIEPDENEKVVSYEKEQERLKHNVQVERKLAEAVQKMQDAMDIVARANIPADKQYTHEEIMAMEDKRKQLRAQKDRVLNASYKLELDMEKQMIDDLKKEYLLFDHRPMESSVKTPPYIEGSSEYKFRHMPIDGKKDIPTALYGMMRFRDVLVNHEKMIEEAERSRQFEKFVNDRLAGYQAWKNTIEYEGQIYQEISEQLDPGYFAEYNEFMDKIPASSTREGYIQWFEHTDKSIKDMEGQIEQYRKEQQSFDGLCVTLQEDLDLFDKDQDGKRAEFDKKIQELDDSKELSTTFYENNEATRNLTQEQLTDLEKQLEEMDLEILKIREDQKVYREGMMKNVQQVQLYGNELKELQVALKEDPEKALSTFTKNRKDVIKKLDESLGKGLEDISKLGLELSNHNGLIKDTEEEIRLHTDEINKLSIRMNEILTKYESDLKQAGKDLDAQTGFFAWAGRKIGTRKGREERNKKFDEAFDRKWDLDAQQTEMKSLETSMQTVEGRLFEAQQNLDAYKKGWENTKNLLETAIQENYEYTQTLQEKLERQADEFDQANREYEEKVKEIQKDNEIQQELHQDILEHTSVEFDKLNAPLIQKKLLRDQLVQQIQEAKNKIAECDENSKKIEKAKEDRAKLVEDKEKFLTDGALSREQMEKELEDAKISASNAKKDLADLHEKYDVRIECHNKLKDFFSQGKVTSNRVLNDLNTAMAKAVDFTGKECQKHTAFLKSRENKLMSDYRKRMTSKETYAERMKPEKGSKKADKAAPINGRIDQYMKHLSSLKKTSNSKEFKNFMGAVMKQYDDVGNFLMGDEIQDATGLGRNRDKVMEDMKKHLTEIVKTADEYMKAKGKASRFTDSGKLRYRFVEEMKADAEEKLGRFAIMEEEKVWIDKLNKMDDSELHVSKDTKFYQTPTYDIVKTAFVKEGELDKADVLDTAGLKRVLPEGLKEVVKEEKPAAGEIKKVETTEIAEEEKTEIKQEEEMENEEEYML